MRRKIETDRAVGGYAMQVCPGSKINFLPHMPMVDKMRAFNGHKFFLLTMTLYFALFFT